MAISMPGEEVTAIELCKEYDCPLHPDYKCKERETTGRKLLLETTYYKINLVCLFCTRAIKEDMKENAKRVILKQELRKK